MPSQVTAYRVFIASPSGLEEERNAFRDVIQEYNETEAVERGVIFLPLGWELMPGGVGRPQAIINDLVRRSDYFVLVLWKKWGSAPDIEGASEFTSGSEEEFSVARECHADATMRDIVVLFKDVEQELLNDPGDDLKRVLEFRRRLEHEKQLLFENFEEVDQYSTKLRRQLARWLREHENGGGPEARPAPSPGVRPQAVSLEAPEATPEESASPEVRGAEELVEQGFYTEAEQQFAVAIGRDDDPDLDSLQRYGRFLVEKGSLATAESTFQRLHALARDRGRPEWVITSLNNLAKVDVAQQHPERAEEHYREALKLREETLGRDHPDVAASLNDLAQLYTSQRRFEEAEDMFKRALAIQGIAL